MLQWNVIETINALSLKKNVLGEKNVSTSFVDSASSLCLLYITSFSLICKLQKEMLCLFIA